MNSLLVALAVSSTFTLYPGFVAPKAQIEAVRDKGLVLEFIVRCPAGTGIMSYSKVDEHFCTPDWECTGSMQSAITKLCK